MTEVWVIAKISMAKHFSLRKRVSRNRSFFFFWDMSTFFRPLVLCPSGRSVSCPAAQDDEIGHEVDKHALDYWEELHWTQLPLWVSTLISSKSTFSIGYSVSFNGIAESPKKHTMYIYIYTYIYIHIHTHVYIYIYTYIHIHTHVYIYIFIYSFIYRYCSANLSSFIILRDQNFKHWRAHRIVTVALAAFGCSQPLWREVKTSQG